ncbi:MAG: hypothetical protein VCC02_00965 [Myxococcota bacterium]|jgi:hypothetical protein
MERPTHPALRRRAPAFRPRFTLGLLYLVGFFFFFSILLLVPALVDVLENVPPGPEQEAIAKQVARHTVRPLLPVAAGLSLLSTLLGAHFEVLPGMRA